MRMNQTQQMSQSELSATTAREIFQSDMVSIPTQPVLIISLTSAPNCK